MAFAATRKAIRDTLKSHFYHSENRQNFSRRRLDGAVPAGLAAWSEWSGCVCFSHENIRKHEEPLAATCVNLVNGTNCFCGIAYVHGITSSFYGNDLERHSLAAAHDDDLVFLTGFHIDKRVGVIVNIPNIAAREFDDLVA